MKKNFAKSIMIIALALVCVCTTGCGVVDGAAKAADSAKETVVNTASDVKETASWWTRSTEKQAWTNSTGTKVEIHERRKEGDYEIKITYPQATLNEENREGVKPTGDASVVMYVDHISDELIDELQTY